MYVEDRQYVSQYAQDFLGFSVTAGGQLVDPDNDLVTVTFTNETTGETVFSRAASRYALGQYQVTLTSVETSVPGHYTATATYTVDLVPETFEGRVEIGRAAPAYDQLAPEMKEIVDSVWNRFADLFDSPDGGPNLQTYFQTNFSRGRIAQLLRVALGTLNTIAQPYQAYTADGNGGAVFPVAQWGALLERATYVEVLKHLRRSYVEQPELMGGSVTRLDRRDYLERWGEILKDEEKDLKGQLDNFKMASMNLGRPAVLVSGGVFGRWAPTRYASSAAARGRFFNRFW